MGAFRTRSHTTPGRVGSIGRNRPPNSRPTRSWSGRSPRPTSPPWSAQSRPAFAAPSRRPGSAAAPPCRPDRSRAAQCTRGASAGARPSSGPAATAWHAGTISVPVCAAHGIWQLQALGGRRTAGAAAGWCAAATRAAPSGTNLPRWAAIAAMSLRFCIGLSISEDWMSYSEERTASRRQQQPA